MLVIVTPYWETHGHTHSHTYIDVCTVFINVFREYTTHHMKWPSLHLRGRAYKYYLINHRTRWKRVSERGRVRSSLLDILLYINLIEMDNTQHLHQWLTATQTTRHPSCFDLSHSLILPGTLENHCLLAQEAIIKTKEMQGRVTYCPFGAHAPAHLPPPKNKILQPIFWSLTPTKSHI